MNTPVARKYAAGDQRRVAVARAARAAAASRRAAAAKRRMLLLTVLGALTLSGWVLSAMTSFPWLIPAVLTAATVGVVELGRRAAVAGQQADAELAEKVRVAEAKAEANADARRPKKHARVVETTATVVEQAPVSSLRVETEVEESTWTPVPVPPPAYTLKAEVRRKIAEPYEDSAPAAPAARVAEPAPEASPAPVVQKPTTEEPAAEETATLNVQEILARRRAVG